MWKRFNLADQLPIGIGIGLFDQNDVEPVFGQIKEGRGFRRFLLRGLENVTAEWDLICLTHNLLKVFGSGLMPKGA